MSISIEDIQAAKLRIGDQGLCTPCLKSNTLSQRLGCNLFIKFENQQFTASFKERGALNCLLAQQQDLSGQSLSEQPIDAGISRRDLLIAGTAAAASFMLSPAALAQSDRIRFRRIRTQFIAALADPQAHSGNNAQDWGLWRKDPGPRGVDLDDYDRLRANGGVARAKWTFENEDWWLEEHGLIMEQPEFPLAAGIYRVTGDREAVAVLTVHAMASDGTQNWELDNNASIYDVTHLRCRSGRYTPATSDGSCSPAKAQKSDFPVRPGAAMPPVEGCSKQDYSVLIVTAIGE